MEMKRSPEDSDQALAKFDLISWPSPDALAASLSVEQQEQQEKFEKSLKRKPPVASQKFKRRLSRRVLDA